MGADAPAAQIVELGALLHGEEPARQARQVILKEAAGEEPRHGGERVEDHHPAGAVELGGLGSQGADPIEIEADMKEPAVEPAGGEEGPPAVQGEHRVGPGRAEPQQGLGAGRPDGHEAAHPNALGIDHQRGDIEERRPHDDRLDEPRVLPQVAEDGGESEHPWVFAAAVGALLGGGADQLAAGGADDRAGALFPKHGGGTLSEGQSLRGVQVP